MFYNYLINNNIIDNKAYYKILNLEYNCSQEDIIKSYKRLVIKNHPDKGGDLKKFQEITTAYNILSDKEKRKKYDYGGINFINGRKMLDNK